MPEVSWIPSLIGPCGEGNGGSGTPGKDGKDGAVYVPHIDAHKVLTFTIKAQPDGVPDPVDLNPNDEWSEIEDGGMDSAGVETGYIWESM